MLYGRICVVCGAAFKSACTNAKYCSDCRYEVLKQKHRARYAEKKLDREPTCTIYTCKRCGKRIKAYGICTNRRICDECLMSTNSKDDLDLLMQRKEVREEVVE